MKTKTITKKMYKHFVKIWFDYYLDQTGNKYMFDLIDGKFIKKFVKLFETPEAFESFLKGIDGHWVQDKLSIRLVFSHKNEIMQRSTAKRKVIDRSYVQFTDQEKKAELLLSQQWRNKHPEA